MCQTVGEYDRSLGVMSLEGKGQTYKRLPARPQITQQADGYGNEL